MAIYGSTYTMAVEPGSSIPGMGLGEAIKAGTQLTLPPSATLSATLTVVLFAADRATSVTHMDLAGHIAWQVVREPRQQR